MRRGLAVALVACALAAPGGALAQESTFELRSSALWANVNGIALLGPYAYCSVAEGFLTLDIADIFEPAVASFTISPDSTVSSFAVQSPFFYLNMSSRGVAVIDASDPVAPRVVGTVPAFSRVVGVAARDSLVYTTGGDTLFTYGFSEAGGANLLAALRIPTREARLAFAGQKLLVFGRSGLFECALGPDGLPAVSDTLFTDSIYVAVGDSAHVYGATAGGRQLLAFGGSDRTGFEERARLPLIGRAASMAIGDGVLAVATDSGFAAYAFADTSAPAVLFDSFDGNAATAVAIDGRTLAVAHADGGIEFSTILLPLDFAIIQNENPRSLLRHGQIDGDFLYVAAYDSGLFRYPASPGPELGDLVTIAADTALSVAAHDSVVVAGVLSVGIKVYSGQPGGAITPRGTLPSIGVAVDLAIQDTLVVVANGPRGVLVAGISDLENPRELSTFRPIPIFNSTVQRVAFAGDRLIYALRFQGGIYILDLADPEFPVQTSIIPVDFPKDFSVDTTTARMVILAGPEGSRWLTLYDITDPAAPAPLDSIFLPRGSRAALLGDFVLVPQTNGGFYRLGVIDGNSLALVAQGLTLEPVVWAVQIPGGAYLIEGYSGIEVFIRTSIPELAQASVFEVGGNVVAVATQDSSIVVGDNAGNVTSLRLTLEGTIEIADTLSFSERIRAVTFFSGDSLCAIAADETIHVVSLDDEGKMTPLGAVGVGISFFNSVTPFGTYLVGAGSSDTVYVVDVSDPAAPRLAGSGFSAFGSSGVGDAGNIREVIFRGSVLFVEFRGDGANRPAMITTWDFSSSVVRPTYLGAHIAPGTEFLSAVIDGSLMYIATGGDGILVLAVEDPRGISQVNTLISVPNPEAVTVVGNFLVSADGFSGFAAFDIRESGTEPPLIAEVDTPGRARGVDDLPGLILVADAGALLVFETTIVTVDSLAPDIAVGLVTNPFITAYADLYLVFNERTSTPPTVRFQFEDLDSALTVFTNGERVYFSRMVLRWIGEARFEIRACDVQGNCGTTVRNVTIDLLRGAVGGTISSDGGAFSATIPAGAFGGDARAVAIPFASGDLRAAGWGGDAPPGGAATGYQLTLAGQPDLPLSVSIAPPAAPPPSSASSPTPSSPPGGWQVYRLGAKGWSALPTWTDAGRSIAETRGGGVFWLAPGEIGGGPAPARAALHPNAPNPFNPRTAIRYDVPAPGARVRLAIYSIEGRLVRSLANGFEPAGPRVRIWDGRNDAGGPVASGAYFLLYDAGREVFTRRMTLLR